MASLTDGMQVRGWSHYVLSYADVRGIRDGTDPHVRQICPDQPGICDQLLEWPGPMCGPHISDHFPVSDAFGHVLNGKLVSVAQIEARPEELEWEFGVDTLPDFRCRGFATAVLRVVTAYIAQRGHVPWHYTDHYNRSSRRLPEKLGYFQYAEGLFSAA